MAEYTTSEHIIEPDQGSGSDEKLAREKLARDRARVERGFWPKLKMLALRLPFLEDVLAAYYCAFDRNTPRHVQLTLFGALAYFVMPFDVMPDMLPLLGLTDDAAVIATALRMVSSHINAEHYATARAAIARGLATAENEARG
jgi:uncharacterized membrane protein YkvA (DUF1232 family)